MQKFNKMLTSSNKEIKATRAAIIADEVKDAMEELLREKKKEKRDLEKQLISLSDLHQDSELSLRVVKKDFNAKQWLGDIINVKTKLLNATIELNVAEEVNNEWFGEIPEANGTTESIS
jgi:phage protein D